jgi:hypothetical protein
MMQHTTVDEEVGDTRSNSLDLTQQNEGEKCVLLSLARSLLLPQLSRDILG